MAEDTQDWHLINGPRLNDGRVHHGCIAWHVNDKIVVAAIGGDVLRSSTEFLDIGTNEWQYGPHLDFPVNAPGTAEISYNNVNEIFLFGGTRMDTKDRLHRIYKLKCGDQNQLSTCHWFRMAQKLHLARSMGIVIQI